MTFICYERCGTCRKAKAWLEEKGVSYDLRPIKEENPTADELRTWIAASGLSVRKFFNTSGLLYKELQLKDKLPGMTGEEMIALLASDGMLVKRPLVITETVVLTGFKAEEWEKKLK